MNSLILHAPAKINLSLDIVGVLPNGYHALETVMQTINLFDTITIKKNPFGQIFLRGNRDDLAYDRSNLAYKAARLMKETYGVEDGLDIQLKKRIPMGAGLGGGSTDAAAVMRGMNILFELNRPLEELSLLGANLGADIPFLIQGGTAFCEGIGEKITHLTPLPYCHILVVKPKSHMDTARVFHTMDNIVKDQKSDTQRMLKAMKNKHMPGILHNMVNVLEEAAFQMDPAIQELKTEMARSGALKAQMSGSGSSVFGLFSDKSAARYCGESLKHPDREIYYCQPFSLPKPVTMTPLDLSAL